MSKESELNSATRGKCSLPKGVSQIEVDKHVPATQQVLQVVLDFLPSSIAKIKSPMTGMMTTMAEDNSLSLSHISQIGGNQMRYKTIVVEISAQ